MSCSWGEICLCDCIGPHGKNNLIMPGCAAGSVRSAQIEKYCHIAAGSFTALLITDELCASSQLVGREAP